MKKETFSYIIFGILTTVVYFISRFLCLHLTNNSMLSVIIAQSVSILFAFITNKLFVFKSHTKQLNIIIPEFFKFVSGRLFVFGIDLFMTFLFVNKFSDFFINNIYSFINYDMFLFHNYLLKGFIGTPKLLNEFVVTLLVQLIAIVSNYFISKYIVFKRNN